MPGTMRPAARELETLFRMGAIGDLTDAQLLERFLVGRGEDAEAAFAAVVERHGPMVLRVCRRILADPNDAEDAFQVTFLVLARKARAIARRALLANWLYGVAVRTSKEVRKSNARRRAREGQGEDMARAQSARAEDSGELRSVIDEELSRLPDTFRAPVVLCNLEGKTHKEAAHLLGVPVGTVSSRLVRARGLLRSRLARRGLDPSDADPPRDSTPMAVPQVLIAATSRAAVRLATGAPLVGAVPAYLATITEEVLKTMLIARLTSRGFLVSTFLCLALGAASVGVVSHALLGADPEPFASARSADGGWSWVDRLQNADDATKERLERCARSAASNFASLHRLIFDYELKTESAQVAETGKTTRVLPGEYRGTVSWKEGSVRYDLEGRYPLHKIGRDGLEYLVKRPKVYSVVRSRDMLAYTNEDLNWGLSLKVMKPPASAEDWQAQSVAPLRRLDPWLHYAQPFCQDRARLREFWENCRAIESEEAGGKVLLRFLRADNGGRVEVTCDRDADWLPVRLRGGQMREGQWIVFGEVTDEWRKVSGVWYPSRHVEMGYYGSDRKPVKEFDLTVRNLRANGAVNLPDSAFTLGAMTMPEGTSGLDNRRDPPRSLIRAGGVVREQRPGEGPRFRSAEEMEAEWREEAERAPAPGSSGAARIPAPNQDYLSLLEEYEPVHGTREGALLRAKTEEERRDAFLALGQLEWSFAPRFLQIALRYPRDDVAIDALGWLVASNFTPPEAQTAADILIRDHLAGERMTSVLGQLAITLHPAPSSAAERLLRAAAEEAPTAEARGLACLKLADLLRYRARTVREMRGPQPDPFLKLEELARSGGREPVHRTDEDPDAMTREAERYYELVVERYAEIPGRGGKLGEAAAQALFQLRDLAEGRPAPQVEGPDVGCKPLRLSDHRGTIVVLMFASGLSGPSRDLYAQGRALIERMRGRPFTVLSVQLDEKLETLRQSIASGEITWPCWWEGGTQRPNCEQWRVGFIPSIYVIDADGIIRARDVRGKALDEAVDALMARMNRTAAGEPGSRR